MTMMPDDDDIKKANEAYDKYIKEKQKPGNVSQAHKSSISTPSQDAQKEQRARNLINEVFETKIQPFEQKLADLESKLNYIIAEIQKAQEYQTQGQQYSQQPQQPQQPDAMQQFAQMPQAEKQAQFMELMKTAAEAYKAFKGGEPSQQGGGFQQMMAEWGMRMFQYHLDNMAQSVYQIKLPPPQDVQQRTGAPPQQPQQQGRPRVHVE